mmetsp:Transcript_8481/g.15337  ORF Transcript_8481/g.15337 Transcript_8481/m.15337 type:complete len:209 (-) Transcript_8481:14-640(-)
MATRAPFGLSGSRSSPTLILRRALRLLPLNVYAHSVPSRRRLTLPSTIFSLVSSASSQNPPRPFLYSLIPRLHGERFSLEKEEETGYGKRPLKPSVQIPRGMQPVLLLRGIPIHGTAREAYDSFFLIAYQILSKNAITLHISLRYTSFTIHIEFLRFFWLRLIPPKGMLFYGNILAAFKHILGYSSADAIAFNSDDYLYTQPPWRKLA